MNSPSKLFGIILLTACVALPLWAGAGLPVGSLEESAKARLKAAEEAYRLHLQVEEANKQSYMHFELCYLWSKRILDAKLDLDSRQPARQQAFREHLDRMKALDKEAKRRKAIASATAAQLAGAQYYVKEAEYWVAKNTKQSK